MTSTSSPDKPAGLVADPQDPLPESDWGPRRWFAFLSLFATVLLAAVSLQKNGVGISWVISFGMLNAFLYLVAPSGEQAVKMIVAGSAMKAGVSFRTSSNVTNPDGGTASDTSSATAAPTMTPDLPAPQEAVPAVTP